MNVVHSSGVAVADALNRTAHNLSVGAIVSVVGSHDGADGQFAFPAVVWYCRSNTRPVTGSVADVGRPFGS
uniref:Unannotated protein n=1 Tax=freshwater metagenome TaxID=449393 RepID=A0A6J7MAU4_9ZZZZ